MALLLAPLALILTLSLTDNKPALAQTDLPEHLVEQFRVTTYEIGSLGFWNINHYMLHESDAMVMTRTALGEAPESFEDRVLVMWLIKIRAELGYKNGRWGFTGTQDRWGPPSSIKMESLCIGGCQFEPWRAAMWVTDPSRLSPTGNLRLMLHPTDEQLPIFAETYFEALRIQAAPLSDAPEIIRGYDGFRSPAVSDTHFIDWKPNGLMRLQFYEGGNVWADLEKNDNHFWDLLPGRLAMTPSPIPRTTATVIMPTAMLEPSSTVTATSTIELLELTTHDKVEPPIKEIAVMEFFEDLIRAAGPQVTTILVLIAGDTILGVAVALKDRMVKFDFELLADFYISEITPKVLGYLAIVAIARFGALEFLGPGLSDALAGGIEAAAWGAIVLSLGGGILSKFAKLGLTGMRKLPGIN